jgi:hypothetical protein
MPIPNRASAAFIAASLMAIALAAPDWAQNEGAAGISPGFVLESAGSLTSIRTEVISGARSIKGSYSGTGSYTAYLRTDPTTLPPSQNRTYSVSFAYRILATPSKGFEVLFYSPTGGGRESFLPSRTIIGVAGDSGKATLKNALGPYLDYQARWNIVGTGAIAIDDIQIKDEESNLVFALEDAEPLSLHLAPAFLPEARVDRGFWVAPAIVGGLPPYTWSIEGGSPPPGLRLDADGELYGRPSRAGHFDLLADVKDASGSSSWIVLKLEVRPASLTPTKASPLTLSDRSGDLSFSALKGREAIVLHPVRYEPAFRNPLEGMRPSVDSARAHPFACLARQYIEWSLLENQESDTVEKIREVTDRLIGDLPAYNIKVRIPPRVLPSLLLQGLLPLSIVQPETNTSVCRIPR